MGKDPYLRWLLDGVTHEVVESPDSLSFYTGAKEARVFVRGFGRASVAAIERTHNDGDCELKVTLVDGSVFTISAPKSACPLLGIKLRRFGTLTCQLTEVGEVHAGDVD